MKKNLNITPNSQIRSALRLLFLKSREHTAVLKRDSYSCVLCGKKQSRAKGKECRVEVHHLDTDDKNRWSDLILAVRRFLLSKPETMICLCSQCHKTIHRGENERQQNATNG